MSLLLISMAFGILMQGSASSMVGLVNGMQLIIHLPIHDVAFPANVMDFLRALLEIT